MINLLTKYLTTCKKCLKQYAGQTVDMFRSRWNNYKDNSRKSDGGEDYTKTPLQTFSATRSYWCFARYLCYSH